jgi:4-hydroxybenzoate polyprenyltransferase
LKRIKREMYFKNQLIICNFFLNSIIGIRFAAIKIAVPSKTRPNHTFLFTMRLYRN